MKSKLQIIGMVIIFMVMIGIMVYQFWVAIFPFDTEQHKIVEEISKLARIRARIYKGLE